MRSTFKGLQVVGRYVGYYPKSVEDDIVQAIYKASPSLVLVSEELKKRIRGPLRAGTVFLTVYSFITMMP